jgi:mRNA interferase ChpB
MAFAIVVNCKVSDGSLLAGVKRRKDGTITTESVVMRGDIYLVSLNPVQGREQHGNRPVLIVSPMEFNAATRLPVVLPITKGGFARRIGFAVEISGIKTTGLVRCDQPRVLDIAERGGRKVDELPAALLDEVLARVAPLFE